MIHDVAVAIFVDMAIMQYHLVVVDACEALLQIHTPLTQRFHFSAAQLQTSFKGVLEKHLGKYSIANEELALAA